MPPTPQGSTLQAPTLKPVDVEHLLTWVGREAVAEDVLTAALVEKFTATFDAPFQPPFQSPFQPHLKGARPRRL